MDYADPELRKKSQARLKYKHKDQLYGPKRVRELERLAKKPHKLGAKLTIRNYICSD
tara:strand:- start:878 stop:1048 length:171 start_codon:yes stop_codon:yes gene_type:complete